MPECPPCNPLTLITIGVTSSVTVMSEEVNWNVASRPPAQPINSSPSSSESRLIIAGAVSHSGWMAWTPPMPISSSQVKINSSGGWTISSLNATANAIASPIPLSAPSVVSLAQTQSSLMTGLIGSVMKSWLVVSPFCATMSKCAWIATAGRFAILLSSCTLAGL